MYNQIVVSVISFDLINLFDFMFFNTSIITEKKSEKYSLEKKNHNTFINLHKSR